MNSHTDQILFLTSFPPRACGIATFSEDLIRALGQQFDDSLTIRICALEDQEKQREYPPEVIHTLNTMDETQYENLANIINADDSIRLLCVQHEFGLFGGQYGEHILYLLFNVNKPITVTFHTVLPNPDDKRKSVVKGIAKAVDRIVVMTQTSARILTEHYDIPVDKITVIPHGIHNVVLEDKEELKRKLNAKDRIVFSTFGLISSNKSIETALDALPSIVEHYPQVLYYVLGSTHPGVVRQEGETYRNFLVGKVKELHLEKHVHFHNSYLSLETLLEYLCMTDIYLFTSRDPHQAVSGTFSYAMSCGCPVIATAIPHAKEMLGDAGVTIDFQNAGQLAQTALRLLDNPVELHRMSKQAYINSRPSLWENVALAYGQLFQNAFEIPTQFRMPDLSFDHLKRMTTDLGLVQFAQFCQPDLDSGYTLDDNARALITISTHNNGMYHEEDTALLSIYLQFVEYCRQEDGHFVNYVDRNGNYHEQNQEVNLEDPNARAILALGTVVANQNLPLWYRIRAEKCIHGVLSWVGDIQSPRSIAMAIKGLHLYNTVKYQPDINTLITTLADRLVALYRAVSDRTWQWFEEYITYDNSTLSEGLLHAYLATGKYIYRHLAKVTFDFLLSHLFTKGHFHAVSNNGWLHKGRERERNNRSGEQPIEISATVQTLKLFHDVFGENNYREKIEIAFSWFLGNNHLHQVMYNSASGGCYDGLEREQVNVNQGAESTVCYLIARMIRAEYMYPASNASRPTALPVMKINHLPDQRIILISK